MNPRVRLALVTAVLCALAAVAGVALAQRRAPATTPAVAEARETGLRGALRPPGLAAGPLRLRDERGRPLDLAQYRGRPLIVAFLYSTCRDTCPLIAQQVRQAQDLLGEREVPAVAVSVDPAGDTPERARRFLVREQVGARMRFGLGRREELAPIWRRFGIAPQTEGAEHSAYVVLVDGAGRQRIGFPPSLLTPEAVAHDVRTLQRERV